MIKNETRESAHLRSRVKDLSVVPNVVSYTGLFAAITPIAKLNQNGDLYEPILIRDTDSLIANFGDPRIDPEKYIDLYSIMQVVGNGTSCYVAKVNSGTSGSYKFHFPEERSEDGDILVSANLTEDGTVDYNYNDSDKELSFTLTSTNSDPLTKQPTLLSSEIDYLKSLFKVNDDEPIIDYHYSTDTPYKLIITVTFSDVVDNDTANALEDKLDAKLVAKDGPVYFAVVDSTRDSLSVMAYSSMTEELSFDVYISQVKPYSLKAYYLNVEVLNNDGTNTLGSAKIKLENSITNQGLVNNLNSSLGTIVRFELADKSTEAASPVKDRGLNSIVQALLDVYCKDNITSPVELDQPSVKSEPKFKVSMNDYIKALEQYKAKKYIGCLMADLVAPVSRDMDNDSDDSDKGVYAPNYEERRALHYNLKQIACERKDCTVILSTPYCESKDNLTAFTINDACDWVTSQNKYVDLWEYGVTNTVDYSEQSFYLEIYFSWLNQTCAKIESGLAKSVKVLTAPANLVINNILTSYRERGVHLPVAGDQYGTLPETCDVTVNPKTKAERDQLVQCRINPIYDTGTRGVQIYGNETLNAGYTDLNAAHIARTLVNIRYQVDEYTETLKFLINSQILWDQWKNYVSMYVLEPFKAANAIAEYDVKMGEDTTSRELIANRTINGIISLRFYQAAEIFDLTFVVYSTATTLEEEGVI